MSITPHSPLRAAALLAAACLALTTALQAKNEEWKDIQGNSFRGEPVEALGPFAIFSTTKTVGHRLPMQALPLPELTRFYLAVKDHPARADDWSKAKGTLSSELVGHLDHVVDKKLVEYSVAGHPEPELFVVLFVSNGVGDSWKCLGDSVGEYNKLATAFPGMMEAVMYGVRHDNAAHRAMATNMNVPFLVTELQDQSLLETLRYFVPGDGYAVVVLTRDGVPVFAQHNPDPAALQKIWLDVGEMLSLLQPGNPYAWMPIAYYRTAIQTVTSAHGHADAELVGNPIRGEVLRKRKIYDFQATLKVTAFGSVSEVNLKPDEKLPPIIVSAIESALKRAVFVPAVTNGKPEESSYEYRFHVDP